MCQGKPGCNTVPKHGKSICARCRKLAAYKDIPDTPDIHDIHDTKVGVNAMCHGIPGCKVSPRNGAKVCSTCIPKMASAAKKAASKVEYAKARELEDFVSEHAMEARRAISSTANCDADAGIVAATVRDINRQVAALTITAKRLAMLHTK